LRHHGIKIYSEDFRQNIRLPKRIRHREEPLTKEILVRLLHSVPMKIQTIILVAIATGMRIGEIVQLKILDVDFSTKPTTIRNVQNEQILNKVIFSRTTSSNSNIKRKGSPVRSAISNLAISLRKYTSKIPELAKLNENGRNVIHFHAFRKVFFTSVSNVIGSDYAHALIGHRSYLDTYYNLPEEERKKMYLQAEPYLTISDFRKVERDLISIKKKQEEIEEKQTELIQALRGDHLMLPKILEKLIK
jgi:integrase